jgi:hypothetical protein
MKNSLIFAAMLAVVSAPAFANTVTFEDAYAHGSLNTPVGIWNCCQRPLIGAAVPM